MTKDNKTVQIILRTTKEEKEVIQNSAKSMNLSINEYIKQTIFNDSKHDNITINNDITSDIINVLKEQLRVKDEQIKNLQTIIYTSHNHTEKLVEDTQTQAKKNWWRFW